MLIKNIGWSFFGTMVSALVGILAVPLAFRLYDESGIQKLMLLWTLVGMLSLADFGLTKGISKVVAQKQINYKTIKSFSKKSCSILAIALFSLMTVVYLLSYIDFIKLDNKVVSHDFVFVVVILVGLSILTYPILGFLEGIGNFKSLSIIKSIAVIISYGGVILASPLGQNIAIPISLIGGRLTLLVLAIYSAKKIKLSYNLEINDHLIKQSNVIEYNRFLKDTCSLGFSSLAGLFFLYYDRFLVYFSELSQHDFIKYIGLAEIMIKGYIIPSVVTSVLFQYFSGLSSRKAKSKYIKFIIGWRFVGISAIFSMATLCIIFLAKEIILNIILNASVSGLLESLFLVLVFFSVVNWFSMINISIAQGLGLQQKVLIIQFFGLLLFGVPSLVISKYYIFGGLVLWFLRVPFVIIVISIMNANKINRNIAGEVSNY